MKNDEHIDFENISSPLKRLPLAFKASAGVVVNVRDVEFEVKVEDKVFVCATAVSCLLLPNVGDTVLVKGIANAGVWILAILVRSNLEVGRIQLPKATVLSNEHGCIEFRTGLLRLNAEEAHVQSKKIGVAFDDVQFVGRTLNATVGCIKVVGQWFSSIADRITQHSHTYSRTTVGMDRVEAEQIEKNASQMVRLKAPYVLVEGDNLVKTKGSQIHFG
jgi:Protein of unknown function (DUF3540)